MADTMTDRPEYVEPHRYTVTFRWIDGDEKSIRVITNRGKMKAVYLASLRFKNPFGRVALDVVVTDEGEPPTKSDGPPILDGCIVDRNEW